MTFYNLIYTQSETSTQPPVIVHQPDFLIFSGEKLLRANSHIYEMLNAGSHWF